jgi:2-methylfumaryl-CoA hydratase
MTEVLDQWTLPHPQLGALRLRMIGLKNIPPDHVENIKTSQGYHPNVVLDLDYTVLIPRKGN